VLILFVVGSSSTAPTVIVTVAVLLLNDPSFAKYVKVSVPLKFASGE
jgi:hypothetical protein